MVVRPLKHSAGKRLISVAWHTAAPWHSRSLLRGGTVRQRPLQQLLATLLSGIGHHPQVPGAGRVLGAQPLQHARMTTFHSCRAHSRNMRSCVT